MTCNEARQNWMLYLDSEGDPELHLRLSDHLAMCSECAQWLARQQRFETAIVERLVEPEDDELWGRVLSRTGVREPTFGRRRRFTGAALVAAFIFLAVFLFWPFTRESRPVELTRLTVDCHERHLRGVSAIEFQSQNDQAIERYIRTQVQFPAHCPPRKDGGFAIEGAGVCRWAPKPMVYFVGRVDETSVSVFVLDRATLDTFPRDRDRLADGGGRSHVQEGGYQTLSALTAKNVVVVVGTAPLEALERILNAYRALADREV